MSQFKKIIISPTPYLCWVIFVIATLVVSGLIDPYVFGITFLILGGISVAVILSGIFVIISMRRLPRWRRRTIALILAALIASLIWAFIILRGIHWA